MLRVAENSVVSHIITPLRCGLVKGPISIPLRQPKFKGSGGLGVAGVVSVCSRLPLLMYKSNNTIEFCPTVYSIIQLA